MDPVRVAFGLQDEVNPEFAVLCESQRIDIAVVPATTSGEPLWRKLPIAGIELKWWSNWYVDDKNLSDLANDLNRVDQYQFPAVALLLFLMVEPAPTAYV
jgi:hypothetical protein